MSTSLLAHRSKDATFRLTGRSSNVARGPPTHHGVVGALLPTFDRASIPGSFPNQRSGLRPPSRLARSQPRTSQRLPGRVHGGGAASDVTGPSGAGGSGSESTPTSGPCSGFLGSEFAPPPGGHRGG